MATSAARRVHEAGYRDVDRVLVWSFAAVAGPLFGVAAIAGLTSAQQLVTVLAAAPFAAASLAYGRRAWQRRRRVRRELQRAAAEWPALCIELAAAARAGIDLDRPLLQLGYAEAESRRRLGYLARQWGAKVWPHQVATGAPAAPAGAAAAPVAAFSRRIRLELDAPSPLEEPALRVAGGVAIVVLCTAGMLQPTRLVAWFCFGAVLGLGMGIVGVEAWVRRAQQRREVRRALHEWEDLAAAAAAARAEGGSVVELLQRRGYRVFEVRQWLLRHLEARAADVA